MKTRTIIIFIILLGAAVGGVVAYKMWNKPFEDPLEGNAIKVSATQLFNDFYTNEAAAQKKYVPQKLGETKVEVTGDIKEVGKNGDGEIYYYLNVGAENSGVKCIIDKGDEIKNAEPGDKITVRGFCDGAKKDSLMDLVMMDVIVNRCKPVK